MSLETVPESLPLPPAPELLHYEANRSAIFAACRRLGWPLGPRPAQQQILDRIFSGQSVLAVLPTSGGKSGLYQIPALAREGMVVVISPLIALMTDQVGRLQRYNIPSIALNSHISTMEKRRAMDRIRSGEIRVLYLSPERMSSMEPSFFGGTKVQLYAIDEAHCHVSGTRIDVPGGDIAVEDIAVGQVILTRLGPGIVQNVSRRRVIVDDLVRVVFDDGRELVVTQDHPFFLSGIGFVPANSLLEGDGCYALDELQKSGLCEGIPFKVEGAGEGTEHLLFACLLAGNDRPRDGEEDLSKVLHGVHGSREDEAGSLHDVVRVVHEKRVFFGSNDPRQSNDAARDAAKGLGFPGWKGSIFELDAGREWSTHVEAPEDCRGVVSAVEAGIFDPNRTREGSGEVGKAGLGRSGEEVGDRGRWTLAPGQEGSGCRSQKGGGPGSSRLVRVARVERLGSCGGSPPGVEVFSLEVSGSNDYFANGVLVHNCISEWGHDFRPAYLRLGKMLDRFPPSQRLALTATATKDVVDEVSSVLKIDPASRIVFGANRPNIAYGVAGKDSSLVMLVKKGGTPCLVYGSTRASVEEAAVELSRSGYRAAHYHAGMNPEERNSVQDMFQKGDYDVVAATCAFGMGVDHPGIRSVVHLEMPSSLEASSQETGRAGRNGDPSKAIVRATVDTLNVARSFVPLTWPSPYRVRMMWRYLDLWWDDPRFTGWLGQGQIQATDTEIGTRAGMEPTEVGSCLRILHDHGHLERIPYRDRPVVVSLLSGRKELKGKRQREVIASLEEHSDEKGEIVGSVGFFTDRIGMDRTYALHLNERHAIRMVWGDRCQVLERKTLGPDIVLDEDRMARVRERALSRITIAEQFLWADGCRRDYLLDYFGGGGTPLSGGIASSETSALCCDRCMSKAAALTRR